MVFFFFFEWVLSGKQYISAFAWPRPMISKEVDIAQGNIGCFIYAHPSVMEPMLDHGRGCVLGTPENK